MNKKDHSDLTDRLGKPTTEVEKVQIFSKVLLLKRLKWQPCSDFALGLSDNPLLSADAYRFEELHAFAYGIDAELSLAVDLNDPI